MDWSCRGLTVLTFYILGLHSICIMNTAVNCTGSTPDPTTNTRNTTLTTPYPSSNKGSFRAFWDNYQVAFCFVGFLLLLGMLCIVVIIRKKSKRQSQPRDRHCGLMTAAIVQLSGPPHSGGSGSPNVEVHPVKPPSYEEAINESNSQGSLPTYTESLRDSFKEYPKHYCQNMKY
uniref:Uncharacterized protein LOC111106600 n=1 Tax=Crassostrea virginica TaxID=6565 RepID=A0A8B8B0U6_CRAVI|nr:uncharacterized protein LOC111106600 [Crassostrea virginica]